MREREVEKKRRHEMRGFYFTRRIIFVFTLLCSLSYAEYGRSTVLWDNGPLVTTPGFSEVQTSLGLNVYGFNADINQYRLADDFTVSSSWNVESITFYAYQTNSSLVSPITGITYRIWDGQPGAGGSSVIFGNTTTNMLIDTYFSGIYRTLEGVINYNRPIMANIASAGFVIGPGTYWLDWEIYAFNGLSVYVPPVTLLGQTTTGNGLQYDGFNWGAALDTNTETPQGFPFLINGSTAAPVPEPSTLLLLGSGLAGFAALRLRKSLHS